MDKTKKKYVILVVVTILVSVIALIGATYALLTMTIEGDKNITLTAGILKVDFAEGDNINLENTAPMTDAQGLKTTPYTFTITNTGNINAYYHVSLEENANNTLSNNYLKMRLTSTDGYDSGVVQVSSYGTGEFDITSEYTLEPEDTVTYTLWMWLDNNAGNEVQGTQYQSKIVVTSYDRETPTAVSAIKDKANSEDLDYNMATDAQKKEMWTFTHPATEQTAALTDYRYIGANPNNYVQFNNELWRIIGVFSVDDGTGNVEERLKIIRNEYIGIYSWNSINEESIEDTNGIGENNWINSYINYLLNPGHGSDNGGSLYWDSLSGQCLADYYRDGTTIPCDFTVTGLKENAKSMIGNALWYLGSIEDYETVTGYESYISERGNKVYQSSTNKRSINTIQQIGLPYISDFVYSTSGSDDADKTACLSFELYSNKDADDCIKSSWMWLDLYDKTTEYGDAIATITSSASNYYTVFGIQNYFLSPSNAINPFLIYPTLYLNSKIEIVDGDGSSSDPYILQS